MKNPRPADHDQIDLDGVAFTFKDIHQVIDSFYRTVATDDLLKVPFGTVQDWPHHIERLTHFWWIRLGGRSYQEGMYNPVVKHFEAGFNADFLRQWLTLFQTSMKKHLTDEQTERWLEIAQHMGSALFMKNEFYKRQMQNSGA